MPVIVSELHFFKVEYEAFGRDAMLFDETVFGVAAEAFQPIDVNLTAIEIRLDSGSVCPPSDTLSCGRI